MEKYHSTQWPQHSSSGPAEPDWKQLQRRVTFLLPLSAGWPGWAAGYWLELTPQLHKYDVQYNANTVMNWKLV